ncbi:branched-chain amino acid ABC transporter permease [Micromonospora sp. NPDC005161]
MTAWRPYVVPLALLLASAGALLANQLDSYNLYLVGQYAILVAVSAALVVLMGGAGLLSLSSAAFLAVGAYGAVIAVTRLSLPFVLAVPLAAAVGGAVGWLLGLVSLRLSGFHLAIVTLGFLQVLLIVLKQGGELTGGGYGLTSPPAGLPGISYLLPDYYSIIAVFVAVVVVVGGAVLMRSRPGRAWLALRDNEAAARMQGINVSAMKLKAFALSSAVISFVGGIYAFILGSTSPASFTVDVSIFHIALVVVGGLTGRISGAVLAPILLFLVPEWFNGLGEYRDLFYAALLLTTLVFLPQGLSGLVSRLPVIERRKQRA